MATTFNKLEKVEENKFGNIKELIENFSTATKPQNLDDDMSDAVPIWVLLGLTEKAYREKYQPSTEPETPSEETATSTTE